MHYTYITYTHTDIRLYLKLLTVISKETLLAF